MPKQKRRIGETARERDIRCGYAQPEAGAAFSKNVVWAWWAFWTALPLHAFNRWHKR